MEDLDLAAVETKVQRKHAEGKLDDLTIRENQVLPQGSQAACWRQKG